MSSHQRNGRNAGGFTATLQNIVDSIVSPNTRGKFYNDCSTLAKEQPIWATFLFIQVLLSATPILFFLGFSIGTIVLSFVSAAAFSIFWIGAALLVLIPILFITVGTGLLMWFSIVATSLIAQWIYSILPINLQGVAEVQLPNGRKAVLSKGGDGFDHMSARVQDGTVRHADPRDEAQNGYDTVKSQMMDGYEQTKEKAGEY